MQVPSRRVLRLLRCPRGAPSSARMRHIFPPSRRSLISSMASSGPALALARRVASVTAALRLNPPLRHVSRFPRGSQNMTSDSRVKGKGLGKPDRHCLIPSANDPIHTTKDIMISMNKHFPIEENKAGVEEFVPRYSDGHPANNEDGSKIAIYGNEHVCRTTVEVTDGRQDLRGAVQEVKDGEDAGDQMASEVSDDDAYEEFTDDDADEEFSSCEDSYPRDDSIHWMALRRSTHRDGSIYRGTFGSGWKNDYRIADRSETRLEAMMLSDPNEDCILEDGTCSRHFAHSMLQIFSVKLAKTHVVDGSVELYGYIAARDLLDPLLNYIVNIGRDDPAIVEKGSQIEMTGPK